MKKIFTVLGLAFLIITIIVVVKTVSNKPISNQKEVVLAALPQNAIEHMSAAIQLRTETPNDDYQFDTLTFMKYRKFLENT